MWWICVIGKAQMGISTVCRAASYKYSVLPKGISCCELLNYYSMLGILQVERHHWSCAKLIQSLSAYASIEIALNCLGMSSLEIAIDHWKLTFQDQLCRLQCRYLAKQSFMKRIFHYLTVERQVIGYDADVRMILWTYNLLHHLSSYISNS